MQRSTDRILTTHVGSLRRPEELSAMLKRRRAGEEVDPDRFEAAVEEATRETITRQLDVGLDLINDGEQPKTGFQFYVYDRLGGLGGTTEGPMWADLQDYPEVAKERYLGGREQPAVTEAVTYENEEPVRSELALFFELLEEMDGDFEGTFFPASTPGLAATAVGNDYYDTYEAFVYALADAMAREYEIIAETGTVLQLDSPDLLAHAHRQFQDLTTDEFREIVELHVDAMNRAVEGIPPEQIRLHTCWGNYPGTHHKDVPLSEVLPLLYEADVGALHVEQANPRHQLEYAAFEEHPVPDDWLLMPGVIDVKTNILEPPDLVAHRIERFADVVGDPSRIVAAPDCGFGTVAGGTLTVRDSVVWAKLATMVEGAALATERLF